MRAPFPHLPASGGAAGEPLDEEQDPHVLWAQAEEEAAQEMFGQGFDDFDDPEGLGFGGFDECEAAQGMPGEGLDDFDDPEGWGFAGFDEPEGELSVPPEEMEPPEPADDDDVVVVDEGPPPAPACDVCMCTPCVCHLRLPDEGQSGRCGACGRPGCWRAHPRCHFHGQMPDEHDDAVQRGQGRHMNQRRVVWRGPGVVEVDDVPLRTASGSGDDNNCLIDSLRQVLRIPGDASVSEQVRQSLREQQVANRGDVDFVEASNFLTMDLH